MATESGRRGADIYNCGFEKPLFYPPMRVLLVKTSSLGDVIHNLPVVSDLQRHVPGIEIDWCVEAGFADMPRLHPGVRRVMPVAVRRWRKALFQGRTWQEIGAFRRAVSGETYDLVLDTQGLVKSALLARWANGPLAGYDANSIREPLAARFYARRYAVSRAMHAVDRNRALAGAALGYVPEGPPDYGLVAPVQSFDWCPSDPYVVLLTATSRDDKLWPEAHWLDLGAALHARGLKVILPAGNPVERARAARLAAALPNAVAAPPLGLPALATVLAGAQAVVGVDTGLTHLAVALDVPTVALYTATDPGLTGVLGRGRWANLGGKGQIPTVDAVLQALFEAAP